MAKGRASSAEVSLTDNRSSVPQTHDGQPLLRRVFFFHIPKTAGTSFNNFLESNLGNGVAHAEIFKPPGEPTRFNNLEWLKGLNYISGHLPFPVFGANEFSPANYFRVTILREPIAHLMSHFNWLIRIREIGGEFYDSHPAEIREISDQIAAADLTCAAQLIGLLERYAYLFQNAQTRTLSNREDVTSLFDAIGNIKQFDLVGLTERFDDFLQVFSTMCGLKSTTGPPAERANANPAYQVTKQWICASPEALDFVAEYNAKDLYLYQYALHSGEVNVLNRRVPGNRLKQRAFGWVCKLLGMPQGTSGSL